MAKIVNPLLFSKKFKIDQALFDKEGLIDPILNADTKLFIDPLLLEASKNKIISQKAFGALKGRFKEIIGLVEISETKKDVAWRNAFKKLDLSETTETCLGYGSASISGSSRPDTLKQTILTTAKEIITLGEKNPQIISLMGLLEEGVGPDTISDMTTNFIKPVLAEITEDFCKRHNIPVKQFPKYENRFLPENPCRQGYPVLFVPKDILRHLPIANDWTEVSKVVLEVDDIRNAVNQLLGDITQATVTERKDAIRKVALQSLHNFREILEAILNSGAHYDANEDIFGYYAFRKIFALDTAAFKWKKVPAYNTDKVGLIAIVKEIIEHFKKLMEDNNLWELIWSGNKPRRERAAQLLFFAVADVFCKTNNIDVSPEMNAGGGPVDFKFSKGYKNKVLVEIKLSTGKVVHGYTKQLEIYKKASNTDSAVFLIMDVGGMKNKLGRIQALQQVKIKAGEAASEIVLIDAKKKKSASKV